LIRHAGVAPEKLCPERQPSGDLKARYITAISGMEQTAIASRSAGERMGDVIALQAGQLWFVLAHVGWFII
jgi:uncharacterized membrane protein